MLVSIYAAAEWRNVMKFINIYGLIFVAVIMIPNIIFAIRCRGGFCNKGIGKFIETAEQIGRFGCFGFMAANIPGTCFGWLFDKAFIVYLAVNTVLSAAYCIIWAVCFKRNSLFRALALSVIPSVMFLFSGIMMRSALLIISSGIFMPSHVAISYKNVKA